MLKVTHRDLVDRALAEVDTLDVDDAVALLEDDDTVFVDLRDPRELEREGKGAQRIPRTARHAEVLVTHHRLTTKRYSPGKRLVFYCCAAGARRWLPRQYRTWDLSVFVT